MLRSEKILFAVVFVIHASIAVYILSWGELGAYMGIGLWEYPFFSLAEKYIEASGSPFELQNIIVVVIGALFWASFSTGIKVFARVISKRLTSN